MVTLLANGVTYQLRDSNFGNAVTLNNNNKVAVHQSGRITLASYARTHKTLKVAHSLVNQDDADAIIDCKSCPAIYNGINVVISEASYDVDRRDNSVTISLELEVEGWAEWSDSGSSS